MNWYTAGHEVGGSGRICLRGNKSLKTTVRLDYVLALHTNKRFMVADGKVR